MLSAHNILSPAHGRPITTPTQDMVLGASYLTVVKEGEKGEGKYFATADEAIMAYEFGHTELHAQVNVRIRQKGRPAKIYETSVGRVIFNTALPEDYTYVNEPVNKTNLQHIVTDVAHRYDTVKTAEILDNIKSCLLYTSPSPRD